MPDKERRRLVKQLMQARIAARRADDEATFRAARERVEAAKVALGEAGPVWWDDGAPDYSGMDPASTPYADWWRTVGEPDDGTA